MSSKNTWKDEHLKCLLTGLVISFMILVLFSFILDHLIKEMITEKSKDFFKIFLFGSVFISSAVSAGIFLFKFWERKSDPNEDW